MTSYMERAINVAAANLEEPQESLPPRFSYRMVGDLVHNLQPIDWLVKDYLEADTLAVFYGQPGHGKSFVAIDIACSIATGSAWHGHKVKAGPVFYIAGEGHNGLGRRFSAWSLARGVDLSGAPLAVSTASAPLADGSGALEVQAACQALEESIGPPALIVVDTLARNFGGDENSTQDMTTFIQNLDRIRQRYNATVLVVHHTGKQTDRGARGSGALKAGADAEYLVSKDSAGMVLMDSQKMKDAPPPGQAAFKLAAVKLMVAEEDGSPVMSCCPALVPGYEPVKPSPSKPRGGNQAKALKTLERMTAEYRQRLEDGGQDPDGAKVEVRHWREEAGLARQRWNEVVPKLEDAGRVRIDGKFAYLMEVDQ